MVSLFALGWPTVDPVLDHAKDVAIVCMVLGDIAQSLEGDLVPDASFASVEEAEEI